ncbi:MAG: UvrD-helicase domain-containing protein [Chloroflexi bacterium]|nr:UvrD-helicase domain-containing protein [Chloroflexota bacterium]
MTLLSQFKFKGNQEKAVTDSSSAIAVTAGAGSGKTLSLVGRYLHLLEQGYPIRSILAITFTEKAAREMRSRIRNALFTPKELTAKTAKSAKEEQEKNLSDLGALRGSNIDSARIGTIHSLCAEILRAHPAEAGLDPAFEVLEEGLSAALQAEAIESALAWAATDEQSVSLFGVFKENELRQILNALMSRRLDVTAESALADFHELRQDFSPTEPRQPKPNLLETFSATLNSYLATHLDFPAWLDSLSTLASIKSSSPEDKLELARQTVLAKWDEIQKSRASKKWDDVLASLAALRKAISTQGQKANWDDIETVRESMRQLKDTYDEHLKFLAEKSRFALDEQLAAHLPTVHRLLDQTLREYQRLKEHRLDFDDLEGLTAQLLTTHPEVREQIQSELRAVLVDEFQDTNDRQRQIVYALTGFNSQSPITNLQSPIENRKSEIVNLFVVGDSKQSIYRFRSADVTVFRQVQADIKASGGELIDLDLTFRAHKPLLEQLNALLAPILGETDDPARPYAVPFAPLHAYRPNPIRENIQPPFIEFHLGLGESADEGRAAAAQALATRLRELHQTEDFAWGDMALLFRSSTAYDVYENALEAADIPFVTVAGRGFYDRPEIRDLLNILAAIADPTDDLALVGALRSPAFAIPDSEIYRLRYPNGATAPTKIFETLSTQVDRYTSTHAQAENGTRSTPHATSITNNQLPITLHPSTILTELHELSSRAPAAAILKRLLDLTHYRAILSSNPNGARMIRNVEKLLADAHRSHLVSLTDFLAYVQTLRDVGLREGEAPADSSNAGAVQLMTVHKAKGLEFPLTVLADAAYEHRGNSAKIQLTDTLLLDLRDDDFHSTAWQLAARLEDDRAQAEDARLLYVAATRAKEKLLISGHVKQKKDGLSLNGWLSHFSFLENLIPEFPLLENGIYTEIYRYSQADEPSVPQPDPTPQAESPRESDLLEPLIPASSATEEKLRARESDPPQRVWRIVSNASRKTPRAPAWLVGRLVHEALRRWRFDDLENFLKPFALESGLTDEAEIHAAIQESRHLLERLRADKLFTELESAERHHEVRYDLPDGRGIMDLFYRTAAGWFIIDFKTDDVHSDAEAQSAISQNGYDRQVARYAEAISNQLKVKAKTRLVFLNVNGEVKIYE